MPTSTTCMSVERVAMSGQRKLFHWSTKANTARVASAGLESGSTTRQKTVHSPAPSSRAASSKSRGMVRKNCRNRKMPHTDTSSVEINPAYVSTQPSALMIRKRGIKSTTAGTISTDRYATSTPPTLRILHLLPHQGEVHPRHAEQHDEQQ